MAKLHFNWSQPKQGTPPPPRGIETFGNQFSISLANLVEPNRHLWPQKKYQHVQFFNSIRVAFPWSWHRNFHQWSMWRQSRSKAEGISQTLRPGIGEKIRLWISWSQNRLVSTGQKPHLQSANLPRHQHRFSLGHLGILWGTAIGSGGLETELWRRL